MIQKPVSRTVLCLVVPTALRTTATFQQLWLAIQLASQTNNILGARPAISAACLFIAARPIYIFGLCSTDWPSFGVPLIRTNVPRVNR
jgi:hypothetical protein